MTKNKPVLYGYFRSSATWRVRIALELKGVDYEQRFINLLKKEQLSEEYKKVNPTQKVPSFITKEGRLLTQSQAIIEYLDEAYPNEPFLPKDPTERALVREICQIIAGDIHPLQNMRVLQRVAGGDAEKQVEFPREVVTEGFKGLEIRLGQLSGTYSFGDRLTMADFFAVPMVGNALRRGVDMTQFPILSRLNESLSELPAFKRAHPSSQPDCPQTN
ncbi:hypothetical protein G6F51_006473 [Rhizopus arrhizus]|uniref:Maleylacetoacetate isomerase n=1 Tax=Rhizopus oryzae TaxID=64495 RepID=A0A9P6YBM5_RHIOR|nr:hypothetical protein G6F51_006473 [Rhizopus arrhizus]KAG1631606.1 hypothetical protein G6F44_010974 [Rhizopus delemar]